MRKFIIIATAYGAPRAIIYSNSSRAEHICVSKLALICSDIGLAHCYYQSQCWDIVNFTLRDKLQWKVYCNTYIILSYYLISFVEENAFEIYVCKMADILFRPQCVKMHTVKCLLFDPIINVLKKCLLPYQWFCHNQNIWVHEVFCTT